VSVFIDRIRQVNQRLNAVVIELFDEAIAQAKLADILLDQGKRKGPLHGVPITIKESFFMKGTATTAGLDKYKNRIDEEDGWIVQQLKESGAIIVGKTNVPQLLAANDCGNTVYGQSFNPWNLERSPGGSTGGEGAIIAACGSPLGLGSDIGGSVRFPAANCGIMSFKPTSRRLTMNGHFPLYDGMEAVLAQPGPMAKCVDDLDVMMRVLIKYNPLDPLTPPVPAYPDINQVDVSKLRVGYFLSNKVFETCPAVKRSILNAVDLLRECGATVEEWDPIDLKEPAAVYVKLLFGDEGKQMIDTLKGSSVHPVHKKIVSVFKSPRFIIWTMKLLCRLTGQHKLADSLEFLKKLTVNDYWGLVDRRNKFTKSLLESAFKDKYDVLLCPSDPLPAAQPLEFSNAAPVAMDYIKIANLTGMPAGVISLTRVQPGEESDRPTKDYFDKVAAKIEKGSAGLPVGVQVIGQHWQEHVVLAVMKYLEKRVQFNEDYPMNRDLLPQLALQ
jgi:fatty acid amide hydrolase